MGKQTESINGQQSLYHYIGVKNYSSKFSSKMIFQLIFCLNLLVEVFIFTFRVKDKLCIKEIK